MVDQGFKRKLAAILSADVKGYSRLMGDDEEATVRTIKAYRAAINDLARASSIHPETTSLRSSVVSAMR